MALLDNNVIPPDVWERLQSPPTALPVIDADLHMCIEIFLRMTNGSQSKYETVCWAIQQCSPEIETLIVIQANAEKACWLNWSNLCDDRHVV